MLILYEDFENFRQIYTDGRSLPVDPQPAFPGYSVGKWEGGTFVVKSAGFNDLLGIDASGHPNSEAMQVTERFRRVEPGRPGPMVKRWIGLAPCGGLQV